ncbi:MAG: aldo/keto reductase [Chloroflexi bacterium]|nr:aldo/keto reductase [Chloroflexota bacterium]MCI0577968.1 aldo/keto reductase [Chloroflexota bacterium]MCI0649278.1 aldo/keto reductase [Chloroflexota bacterium]MCI0729471.1 aldo/keto reductase [Chloroflexota bacterium]
MELRTLGNSGLTVSPIGLGLAALGRPGYINLGHAADLDQNYQVEAMQAHAHQILDAAWAGGIRYFDAARSYGRAEHFLASWLAGRRITPEEVTVGSKWGYTYTAGWQVEARQHEVKEHSLAVLWRQAQESLDILGQHLDLYQVHSATLTSGVLDNRPVLDELARLRAGGLKIGLTLSGPQQTETLRQALTITYDGRLLFDSAQATWNLLEQSAAPALQEASQAGLGIIVKEALANGRLTPRNDAPEFQSQRALLEQVAAQQQTTIDALALAAALAQPWASVVLSGAATAEQVHSNLKALEVRWDDEAAARLAPLLETPEAYWRTRDHLKWN